MKSVLKTFSQSMTNMMAKACLTVLCVFVLSNVGSAQSFIGAPEAAQLLKPVVSELQQEYNEQNPGLLFNHASTDELSVRYAYYNSLMKFFGGTQPLPLELVIEKNHGKMLQRYNSTEATSELLLVLKQEATNLLSN